MLTTRRSGRRATAGRPFPDDLHLRFGMTTSLERAIDELLELLEDLDVPVAGSLNPGLGDEEIFDTLQLTLVQVDERAFRRRAHRDDADDPLGAGLVLSRELISWFGSMDGLDPSVPTTMGGRELAPGFEPLSLRRALVRRKVFVETSGDPEVPDLYLPGGENYFPIASAGRYVTMAKTTGGETSPIHCFHLEDAHETHHRIHWPSMEAMVENWTARWRDGRLVYDSTHGIVESGPSG